jgi:arylsulfatase
MKSTHVLRRSPVGRGLALAAWAVLCLGLPAHAQQKPNILVIWGDDIGTWNISHNNRG